jgi:hypothetical protein
MQPRPTLRDSLRLPLWAQWALSALVATVAIVLLVRFVDANSTPQAQAPHVSAKGARIQAQEEETLTSEDQAPQVAHFAGKVKPRAAIANAITAFMQRQAALGAVSAPEAAPQCFPVAGGRGGDLAYVCSVYSGGKNSYPFEGVVNPAKHTVTYCKHDPPPSKGGVVPLSARCTA